MYINILGGPRDTSAATREHTRHQAHTCVHTPKFRCCSMMQYANSVVVVCCNVTIHSVQSGSVWKLCCYSVLQCENSVAAAWCNVEIMLLQCVACEKCVLARCFNLKNLWLQYVAGWKIYLCNVLQIGISVVAVFWGVKILLLQCEIFCSVKIQGAPRDTSNATREHIRHAAPSPLT